MAVVAFDAKSSAAATGTSNSFSTSNLTVGSGSNRALIGILTVSNTPGTATMTWGGTSMTLLASQVASDNSTKVFIFGLRNPASGTLALAGTIASSQDYVVGAASFTNVEQSSDANAFKNIVNAQAAASPAAVNVTSPVGNMIVAGFSAGSAANPSNFSSTSGTTIFTGSVATNGVGGAGTYLSGASTPQSASGTYTIANANVAVGISLQASGLSVDAQGTAIVGSTLVTSITGTPITVGAGATALLVGISLHPHQTANPTVTWDSGGTNQAMTFIGVVDDTTNNSGNTYFYGLLNPTAGAKTLAVSWTTSTARSIINAMSFFNTLTSSVTACFANFVGGDYTTSGTSFDIFVPLSSPGASYCIGWCDLSGTTAVAVRSDFLWFDTTTASTCRVDAQTTFGQTGVNHDINWQTSVGNSGVITMGIEVTPAPTGPGPTVPLGILGMAAVEA